MEDNIDNKLITYLGSDTTGGSSSSNAETKIGQVIISANSARKEIHIFANIRYKHRPISGTSGTGTFRIRTGTSATATSNTQRLSQDLDYVPSTGSTGPTMGGFLMFRLTNDLEDFTQQFYVHITGQNTLTDGNITSYCDFIYVLGI